MQPRQLLHKGCCSHGTLAGGTTPGSALSLEVSQGAEALGPSRGAMGAGRIWGAEVKQQQ